MRTASKRGQATLEFVLLSASVVIPLTFAIVFTAELLWAWHSVVELTRDGARYATTHCWQADTQNVTNYMKTHTPPFVDMNQIVDGEAELQVTYMSRDPSSGQLVDFACDGDCSTLCIPDTVTVRLTNYQFRQFVGYLGIPPVTIPDFYTTLPMESAGCDPEQGTCLP